MQSSRSFTLPRPPFSGLFAQHQCVRVTGRVYEYNKKICGKNIKCATRSFYYPTAAHRHTETPWSPHPLSRTSGSKLTGDGHWSNCCQCFAHCFLIHLALSRILICVCVSVYLSLSVCLSLHPSSSSLPPPPLLLPPSAFRRTSEIDRRWVLHMWRRQTRKRRKEREGGGERG